MANVNEDLFAQYAKKVEEESKKSSGGSFQRSYEEVAWTGLDQGIPKIVRVLGGVPDSNKNNYTAKTCTIAWITGDDGKVFKAVMPPRDVDPNYILTRIISQVKRVRYDAQGNKTYPVLEKFPEIYNLIDKNGLQKTDKRYMFERGWSGKDVLIMNVIDRSQMDWHREHKHTMLLAKSVTTSNGREYVDEGVSSFAIQGKLGHLFKSYGDWEHYDIAITKTGMKDNAFILVNASHSPAEVDETVRQFISENPDLTPEERSWTTYDIAKFYQPTSATKIYNRLKATIARIDTALGTCFLTELEALMKKEQALRAEQEAAEKEAEATTQEAPAVQVAEPQTEVQEKVVPRTRERVSVKKPGADLPYFDTLPEEFRDKIISAKQNSDGRWDIEWAPGIELGSCPDCGAISPYALEQCPACGAKFEIY